MHHSHLQVGLDYGSRFRKVFLRSAKKFKSGLRFLQKDQANAGAICEKHQERSIKFYNSVLLILSLRVGEIKMKTNSSVARGTKIHENISEV